MGEPPNNPIKPSGASDPQKASYRCLKCKESYPLETPLWCCPKDGSPLELSRGKKLSRNDINTTINSVWRYGAALNLSQKPLTLGEGSTPLIEVVWEQCLVHFKLENLSATGSFKDRGAAVLTAYLRECGIRAIAEDSSGNAGAAMSAYAAANGLSCRIYVPAQASPAKIIQIASSGADIVRIGGSRHQVAEAAIKQSDGYFYASHNWQPFFLEGTKTLAYEIWEDLGFYPPDNIVIPVGGGSSLLGLFIGFSELLAHEEINKLPRLFGIQAEACAPLHAAYQAGMEDIPPISTSSTIAEGIALVRPIRAKQILRAIRASKGGTASVSENEIKESMQCLGKRGFFVEPTSAVAVAGLNRLTKSGAVGPTETTVVLLTGSGLKSVSAIGKLLNLHE